MDVGAAAAAAPQRAVAVRAGVQVAGVVLGVLLVAAPETIPALTLPGGGPVDEMEQMGS